MSLMSECCSASTSSATSTCAGVMVRSLGDNPRQRAAMQQIADWLQKLGMSAEAQRFAENRVDFSVLSDLTDQDLKDLGVVLGDRRKMLRAIGELAGAGPVPSQVHTVTEPKPQDIAERRQVTVMFSDLVGSTELAA